MSRFYRRSRGIASRVIDGEAILVNMRARRLYVLNGGASRIWVEADGATGEEELLRGVDAGAGRSFLEEMERLGLMEAASERTAPDRFPQEAGLPGSGGEAPAVKADEAVEVLAGICLSDWGIVGNCRVDGCTNTTS